MRWTSMLRPHLCLALGDDEVVYMKIPPGFTDHYGKGKVLRLRRSLYGLCQSLSLSLSEAVTEAVAQSERHNADAKGGAKEEEVAVFTSESITEKNPSHARQEKRDSSS